MRAPHRWVRDESCREVCAEDRVFHVRHRSSSRFIVVRTPQALRHDVGEHLLRPEQTWKSGTYRLRYLMYSTLGHAIMCLSRRTCEQQSTARVSPCCVCGMASTPAYNTCDVRGMAATGTAKARTQLKSIDWAVHAVRVGSGHCTRNIFFVSQRQSQDVS